MHTCIQWYTNILFPKKQIPVIYLVYTRITKAKSIYQVYTRYIPCLNFLGFPDEQRLLIPTVGVTAAYAEKAHKVTLNASSDIFARRSKLQTLATRSRFFFASTISMLWVRRT